MNNKRNILKKAGISIFLFLLVISGLYAQKPGYLCELRNDLQVDARTFEFDMYLLRTGATPFQLANIQAGILIDAGAANGGTISVSLVDGSSELNSSQRPLPIKFSFNAIKNCIIMTAMSNPGPGNGTIISNAGFGTRIGRFRLTNTSSFGTVQPNLTWGWSIYTGYITKVSAYVNDLAEEITEKPSHTVSNLNNLVLNPFPVAYQVTGGGSYCEGEPGLEVGLEGSETDVSYSLYKDGATLVSTVDGTGSALDFGPQLAGTYSISGSNLNGTTEMTGTAILTETPSLTVGVTVSADNNPVCSGSQVTFTATPVNGGETPVYQWYKGSDLVGTGGDTYSYIPDNGDVISVVMTSGATSCLTGSPATSNSVVMTVNPELTASVSVSASANPVCSGTPVTFTATPTNGGTTPLYQWYIGSDPVGSGGDTYSYIPDNGDVISVTMTSVATACLTGSPSTSNQVALLVHPLPEVILASVTPSILGGTGQVVFSATASSGTIKWYNAPIGGTEVTVLNPVISETTTYYAEAASDDGCVSATRTGVTALVIPTASARLSFRFANPRIVNTSGADNFEFDVQVKADEAGTYLWSGQIDLAFDNTTLSTEVSDWVVTKAGPFNADNSLGNPKYDISLNVTGAAPDKKINIIYSGDGNAMDNPAAPADFVEISTTYQTLLSVKGRIQAPAGVSGIDFTEPEMNGKQYCKLSASPGYAAYQIPNEYDDADFSDIYVGRIFSASHSWTQIGGSTIWANAVNTSVWDGNAATPGNLLANASNLRIHNPAKLTLPANGKMTVPGTTEIKTTAGLTINSDALGTGSFITGGVSGAGSTIAQRYMTTDAWHIVTSPVSGQSIAEFLALNENVAQDIDDNSIRGMMDYNPEANDWNAYFTNATPGNLEAGKGFCIRNDADGAVVFSGNLQSGDQQVTGLSPENWNCVGNPYTSAIGINDLGTSASNFLNENVANLDPSFGAIYVWDNLDINNNNGEWGKYTIISNTPTGTAFDVQQGQAFMVKMNAGISSLSFNSGMQIHEPALPLKSTKGIWPTIKLEASFISEKASTIIAFKNGMTNGLDPTYDAGLLKGSSDLVLYSRLIEDNGLSFAIQALPANDFNAMIIPIGIDFTTGGEVVFSAELINLPPDCMVILEDKNNQTFTDLSKNVYKTTIAANSSISDRFRLHTSYLTTGLDLDSFTGKLSAYAIRNVEIRVKGQVSKQAIATLYDIQGRAILVKNMEGGSLNVIRTPNIRTGIYMLFVKDKEKTQGFKIPVKE